MCTCLQQYHGVLIAIDACKRASAGHISVVMPYFGYARQDRKAKPRQPITSKLVADLLERAGANRVITMELHATQIQGFFDIPADDISAICIIGQYFKSLNLKDVVVVSPDHGGTTRARRLAEILHAPLAIIDKRRPKPNVAEAMNIIGDVNGKIAIVVDDIVDTAGTLTAGIQMLYDKGATAVYASCVHGVLSGPAIDRLKAANLEEFVCTNTIPQDDKAALYPQMKVLSCRTCFRTGYQGCGRKQTSQRNRCEIRRVSYIERKLYAGTFHRIHAAGDCIHFGNHRYRCDNHRITEGVLSLYQSAVYP